MPTHRSAPLSVKRLLAAAGVGALLVPTLLVGVASAAGEVGSPQPEAARFTIGAKSDTGSSVVATDGSLVVAYDLGSTLRVCRLARGARKCTSVATLAPIDSGASLFGVPQVFAPAANTIVVLQETSGDGPDKPGTLLYTSTTNGKTFSSAVRAGGLSVTAATLVGNTVVWTAQDDHDGLEVQTVPAVGATGVPSAETVVEGSTAAYDTAIGHVKGGVLLGSDDLTSGYSTTIRYAAAGSDPDQAASYGVVATFPGEQLLAISGGAVLTRASDSKETLRLRLFDGTSFTAASVVPGANGRGAAVWSGLDVDPSGLAHVFVDSSINSYDLYQINTRNGSTWSSAQFLGDAVAVSALTGAIDSAGTGIVFGSDGVPTIYPLLAPQKVTITLTPSTIAVGSHTIISGKATPAAAGRAVELQYLKNGKWYDKHLTHEGSSGKFASSLTGAGVAKITWRWVVTDVPGHFLYGYSAGKTLTIS